MFPSAAHFLVIYAGLTLGQNALPLHNLTLSLAHPCHRADAVLFPLNPAHPHHSTHFPDHSDHPNHSDQHPHSDAKMRRANFNPSPNSDRHPSLDFLTFLRADYPLCSLWLSTSLPRLSDASLFLLAPGHLDFPQEKEICATHLPHALSLARIPSESENPIVRENARPGTSDWVLKRPAAAREIEGYASAPSFLPNSTAVFFVNSSGKPFRLSVFRLGWYGGAGGRLVLPEARIPGLHQPGATVDAESGLAECCWRPSHRIRVDSTWPSGQYLAKLRLSDSHGGWESYIPFVVADPSRFSSALVVLPVATAVAYNPWGGRNAYAGQGLQGQATAVSLNRPFGLRQPDTGAASGVGSGELLAVGHPEGYPVPRAGWEVNAIRFLEREGRDVGYCSGLDVHKGGVGVLLRQRAVVSIGHDEYWSKEMRDAFEEAREKGVHMVFMGSNVCFWQVRWESARYCKENENTYDHDSSSFDTSSISSSISSSIERLQPYRTLVIYKGVPDPLRFADPSRETIRWKDVGRSEETLVGVRFVADPVFSDVVVRSPQHWVFEGTGLRRGARLEGLLGYEVDQIGAAHVPRREVLAESPWNATYGGEDYGPRRGVSHMVLTQHEWGAMAFATGTMQFAWGLDDYNAPELRPRLATQSAQRMMRNVLARFAMPFDSPSCAIHH